MFKIFQQTNNKQLVDKLFRSKISTDLFASTYFITTNYRPVSVINNFSKISEKQSNNISKKHFGFRTGISIDNAILDLTRKFYKAFDCSRVWL